jgi:hypothetical protein
VGRRRAESARMKPERDAEGDLPLGPRFAARVRAAERLDTLLPELIEWQPILLGCLFKATGRSSWSLGDDRRRQAGMAEIERRASAYGLLPVRWPDQWPTNYLTAMFATTFAFTVGRRREFTMQAFRNAFQEGSDLSVPERVFEVGAARCARLPTRCTSSASRRCCSGATIGSRTPRRTFKGMIVGRRRACSLRAG